MIKAVIFDMFETLITHYRTPLYFGSQMARDAGVDEDRFLSYWRSTENMRTVGDITFDKVIENILIENGVYDKAKLELIVAKRISTKKDCFEKMHKNIIPLFERLKGGGVKTGLISNCFSEEAAVIRESVLFKYFDAACLSYELKMRKPDRAIYMAACKALDVSPDECLYVGDGGSRELEAAEKIGMHPLQAMWYSYDEDNDVIARKPGFIGLDDPLDVLDYV